MCNGNIDTDFLLSAVVTTWHPERKPKSPISKSGFICIIMNPKLVIFFGVNNLLKIYDHLNTLDYI
ncbi:hypothetical protein D3C71_1962030 [compost metagenome]